MSKLRIGNIVYYEDITEFGYPVCLSKEDVIINNISFDRPVKNDGIRDIYIKPLEFNSDDFWENNKHLQCVASDIPNEIIYLHDFQNWYEDKFGYKPKIYRGNNILNK